MRVVPHKASGAPDGSGNGGDSGVDRRAFRVLTGPVARPRHRKEVDPRAARAVLDGCGAYGVGHDDLVDLVAELMAPPAPGELRGEAEALLAFRAGRASLAHGESRPRETTTVLVPARRAAPAATGLPVIGSVFAVAASAAIGVLAWTASPAGGPGWTIQTPSVPVAPAGQPVAGHSGSGGGSKPAAVAGASSVRSGGSGSGRGPVRPVPGVSGEAAAASAGTLSNVGIASVPDRMPTLTPSASASAGGVDPTEGGGTIYLPEPSPARGQANSGSTLGGNASSPVVVLPSASSGAPTPVASASAAPSAAASSVPSVTIAVAPGKLPKGLCASWLKDGGSAGTHADDAKYVPLVSVAGNARAADEGCRKS